MNPPPIISIKEKSKEVKEGRLKSNQTVDFWLLCGCSVSVLPQFYQLADKPTGLRDLNLPQRGLRSVASLEVHNSIRLNALELAME